MKSLREEYAGLLEQKRKAYSAYKQARADMKELYNVRANVEHFFGYSHRAGTAEGIAEVTAIGFFLLLFFQRSNGTRSHHRR